MNFERGQEVKRALRIGKNVHQVIAGHRHKPGEEMEGLTILGMQAIMEGYKKGFYPTDPADFFISIGYTDDNGIYQEVPPLRVRAMQGEFLDIGGKIYKVPDFAPAFPGYEKFHPDAYRKNEI